MQPILMLFCAISTLLLTCSALPVEYASIIPATVIGNRDVHPSSAVRGTDAAIDGLPDDCAGDISELLENDADRCDAYISDLSRESAQQWVRIIIPDCNGFNITEGWADPDISNWDKQVDWDDQPNVEQIQGSVCEYQVTHHLTHEGKITWILGMMPTWCPFSREHPKITWDAEGGLDHLSDHSIKVCNRYAYALFEFVDANMGDAFGE